MVQKIPGFLHCEISVVDFDRNSISIIVEQVAKTD